MRMIPWVEVIERYPGTFDAVKILESYPFPDVSDDFIADYWYTCTVDVLNRELNSIEDEQQRKSQLTRLSFILDIWHPKNFVRVIMKEWKYQ